VGAAAKWINVDCQKENKKRATHPNQRRRRGKTASRNRASELRAQPTRRSGHEGSHEPRSEGDGAAGKGGRRSTVAGGRKKREEREGGERETKKKRNKVSWSQALFFSKKLQKAKGEQNNPLTLSERKGQRAR